MTLASVFAAAGDKQRGFGATFMGTTSLVMPLARQLSVPRNINLLGPVT